MWFAVIALSLFYLADLPTARSDGWQQNKIVGGVPVDITEHPYALQFNIFGFPSCGAVLIDNKFALTAAHCASVSQVGLSVRAGTSFLKKGGVVVKVIRTYIYPLYRKSVNDYDLAVLELEHPLVYSSTIQPVKLPDGPMFIQAGVMGKAVGWGYTSVIDPEQSPVLREASLPITDINDCMRRLMGAVHPVSMFCAGFLDGTKDSCQGDSGGPFVVDGMLIGLISFGVGCAEEGYPGVYANVANLRWFIRAVTGI